MGDLVYIGSCAGRFYAFNVDSGHVVWSYDVLPDGARQFHGKPLIVDSLIVFGTDDGRRQVGTLYALHRLTGELIWKKTGDVGIPSDAAFDGDSLIYLVDYADRLLALSLITGEVVWQFATGWQHDPDFAPAENIRRTRTVSSPILMDDRIYFVGRDSTLYCRKARNGVAIWSRHFDAVATSVPLILDDEIFLSLSSYRLLRLSAADGTVLQRDKIPYLIHGRLAVTDSLLICLAGSEDNQPRNIMAFNPNPFAIKWDYTVENPDAYWYCPRVHLWRNQIIVGSTHGQVAALSVDMGTPLWQLELKEAIRGVGHGAGRLFIGTYDGTLYALSLQPSVQGR